MKKNEVKRTIKGILTKDGAGVSLIRVLGQNDLTDIDPFLMMDAFDTDDHTKYMMGFPEHPHRGIETVTYLINGQMNHGDSLGNNGSIKGGQAQWMTAGSGILHSEMPQKSDRLFGIQLWLNLSAKDKMTPPTYFDINESMISTVDIPEGNVRILSGEFQGVNGVEPPHEKVVIWDVTVNANETLRLPVNPEYTLTTYSLEGTGTFGTDKPQVVENRTAIIFTKGNELQVTAGKEGVRFLLLSGKPLDEPIAWAGPIVMNTEEELQVAYQEFSNGTFIK